MKKQFLKYLRIPGLNKTDGENEAEESNFLIYQMGKVGSKTIHRTLIDADIKSYHTHRHVVARRIISETKCKLIVISGYREPLARTISAFFQNMDNKNSHWFLGDRNDILRLSTQDLIKLFDEKLEPHLETMLNPWFDNFLDSIEMDRTQLKMNEWGFTAASNDMDILGYKLEKFSDFGAEFFKRFSGVLKQDGFKDRNLASEKWYAPIYRDFVASYKISEEEYDRTFSDTSFSNYVYTKPEIKLYARKFLL